MTCVLSGKRIVNTRALHQAQILDRLLRERGAEPLSYPCIAIVPAADSAPLNTVLRDASGGQYDWLVITSVNTVMLLAQQLAALKLSLSHLSTLHVAAVGNATAQAVEAQLGLVVNLIPDEFTAAALAESLKLTPDARVLLPESALADPALADALTRTGARVTVVEAYRTILGIGGVNLPHLLANRQVDAITLTSASTVKNLVQRLESEGGYAHDLAGVCLACIGPQTERSAQQCGLSVSVVAQPHTLPGLVASLENYFENPSIGR